MARKDDWRKADDSRASQNEHGRFAVVPDEGEGLAGEIASSAGATIFSAVLFAITLVLVFGAFWLVGGRDALIIGAIVGLIVASLITASVHIAAQWERVVVLRLGKYNRVCGPGLFFTIPIIESNAMRVDMRVRTTSFGAEETLTADLVPLDVDAVLFWMVWDAKAACTEVGDFTQAVRFAAQTALRDAIGRGGVAEVAIRREQLDRELKSVLEEKVGAWGITVLSVEIRDIVLPKELQGTMSLEAQAEQRKKARIILMEAEQDIADIIEGAGESYAENDAALRLRAMHLLYESVRETGGTIVVPSSFAEGFGDVLPDTLKATVGK